MLDVSNGVRFVGFFSDVIYVCVLCYLNNWLLLGSRCTKQKRW
jgi:hypothetical protein